MHARAPRVRRPPRKARRPRSRSVSGSGPRR
jgi:hypothetical protein